MPDRSVEQIQAMELQQELAKMQRNVLLLIDLPVQPGVVDVATKGKVKALYVLNPGMQVVDVQRQNNKMQLSVLGSLLVSPSGKPATYKELREVAERVFGSEELPAEVDLWLKNNAHPEEVADNADAEAE